MLASTHGPVVGGNPKSGSGPFSIPLSSPKLPGAWASKYVEAPRVHLPPLGSAAPWPEPWAEDQKPGPVNPSQGDSRHFPGAKAYDHIRFSLLALL